MAGARAAGRAGGAVLALALVVLHPPSARAEDTSAFLTMPGSTIAATTVDIDGDGDRELVQLVDDAAGRAAAEAWRFDGASWVRTHTGRVPGGLTGPQRSVTLVPWSHDGAERLLLASSRHVGGFGDACCIALWQIGVAGDGLTFTELPAPHRAGTLLDVVDLDGDGTDELVIQSQTFSAESGFDGTATNEVLRLAGDRFEPIWARGDPNGGSQLSVVDSDGIAGSELLIGPAIGGEFRRVSWRGGALHVEEGDFGLASRFGLVVGAAEGVIVLLSEEGMQAVRWPADAAPSPAGRPHQPATPWATVVTDGDTAAILTVDGLFGVGGGSEAAPQAVAYDLGLNEIGRVPFPAETGTLLRFLMDPAHGPVLFGDRSLYPYLGVLPGTIEGRAAMAAAGALVQLGADGELDARPMSPMLGVWPIGRLGPDDAWIALAHDYPLYLPTAARFAPQSAGGPTTLVPIDQILEPPSGTITAQLGDAVEVERTGADVSLLARSDGFVAQVSAPEGSVVVVSAPNESQALPVENGRATFEVRGRRNRGGDVNEEFERTVMVIYPHGAATMERWHGAFVHEPPALTARARTQPFALTSTVTGRVTNGAAVTVDGQSATLTPYGAFHATVDAPPWPRTVVVTARDPLGNETSTTVEVIGLVDYRGFPWAVILAAATVAAGAFLYLRAPRQPPIASPVVEGTVEEIDGD